MGEDSKYAVRFHLMRIYLLISYVQHLISSLSNYTPNKMLKIKQITKFDPKRVNF